MGEFIQGGTAFLGLLFATVLSGLALWGRISSWLEEREVQREERFKLIVVDAISEHGLIKPGTSEEIWPNGSDNMPDFLLVLWESLEATQAGLHEIRKRVCNGFSSTLSDDPPDDSVVLRPKNPNTPNTTDP